MNDLINVYCDESCHLENDGQPVMVLGALWCPAARARELNERIRAVKQRHGKTPGFEIKWTKVSASGLPFYLELLGTFFQEPDLHFRCLVASKAGLDHAAYGQSHDDWYYKMYFDLLKVILAPTDRYRVYLDIKDSRSAGKARHLREVLCNNQYDFSRSMIEWVQNVHSHEVELLQLSDLLIGAVAYANRRLEANAGKRALVESIRQGTGYSLTRNTLLLEAKFNIFCWQGREAHP